MLATAHKLDIYLEDTVLQLHHIVVLHQDDAAFNVWVGLEVHSVLEVLTTGHTLEELVTVIVSYLHSQYQCSFIFIRKPLENFSVAGISNCVVYEYSPAIVVFDGFV